MMLCSFGTRTAAPLAAIFILFFSTVDAQSESKNNRKAAPAEVTKAQVRGGVSIGPAKLPFEPVVIYYNGPDRGVSRSAPRSTSAVRNSTNGVGFPDSAKAKTKLLPRDIHHALPAASQTSGFIGLQPVMIYYRAFTRSNTVNASAAVRGANVPKQIAANLPTVEPSGISTRSTFAARPTMSKIMPGPNYVGESILERSLSIKPLPMPPPVKTAEPLPAVVTTTDADQMMSLNPRPLPSMPKSPAAVNGTAPVAAETAHEVVNGAATPQVAESVAAESSPVDAGKRPFAGDMAGADAASLNNTAVHLTLEARYDEAQAMLEQAIKAEPAIARFHRNLSVLFERMKKYDEALASARRAEKLAPADPSVLEQLCLLELAKNNPTNAVGCYERLNSVEPLAGNLAAYYGIALFRSGKETESIEVLEKAARSMPPVAEALNALGTVYYQKKRITDAIAAFKSAVEANPELPGLRYNLAVAQFANGNKAGAISQYNIIKSDDAELANELYQMIYSDKVVSVSEMQSGKRH